MKILRKNKSIRNRDGDWIDVIEIGKYSEIVEITQENTTIRDDISPVISSYIGGKSVDVCLIRLGNSNNWSNYSIIFDTDNKDYIEVNTPYENDLSSEIYFDNGQWFY